VGAELLCLKCEKNLKSGKNYALFIWGFGQDHNEPEMQENLKLRNRKFCCIAHFNAR
jgi:hypothetical protein